MNDDDREAIKFMAKVLLAAVIFAGIVVWGASI